MVRFYVHFETHENHLFKFSPDWQLLKKKPLPANIPFGFFGNQTIEDQAGNLWIGATNGKLLRFNPKTGTFEVFSYQALMPQSGNRCFAVFRRRLLRMLLKNRREVGR